MKPTLPQKRTGDCQARWLTWRIVAVLFAVTFLFAPAAIITPRHADTTAPAASNQAAPVEPCVGSTCSQALISIRAAVEQAALRVPVPPLLLLATVMLVCAVWQRPYTPTACADRWWPLGRLRSLLQVFLV